MLSNRRRRITQRQKDERFVNQLLEVARDRYGTDIDGNFDREDADQAYMFVLLCDAVRAYAVMEAGNPHLPKDLMDAEESDIAQNTLGPVVANVCPGWVIEDDGAYYNRNDERYKQVH